MSATHAAFGVVHLKKVLFGEEYTGLIQIWLYEHTIDDYLFGLFLRGSRGMILLCRGDDEKSLRKIKKYVQIILSRFHDKPIFFVIITGDGKETKSKHRFIPFDEKNLDPGLKENLEEILPYLKKITQHADLWLLKTTMNDLDLIPIFDKIFENNIKKQLPKRP